MMVNNSGFPGSFIISTFDLSFRVWACQAKYRTAKFRPGFALSTNWFHLQRNCFRSMKLILKDNGLYHSDPENRTLRTFKKFECSGKFPCGTTRKAAVMHSLSNQICWKPFVKKMAIIYKI